MLKNLNAVFVEKKFRLKCFLKEHIKMHANVSFQCDLCSTKINGRIIGPRYVTASEMLEEHLKICKFKIRLQLVFNYTREQ